MRSTVAEHVGDPLAHRPGEQAVHRRRRNGIVASHREFDAGGIEHIACALQLVGERALPVPGHHRAHLGKGLARNRLDVADRCSGGIGVAVHQAAGDLRLERDHRQAVAKDVMNIAGDAQALIRYRESRDLGPRGAELDDRRDQAAEREHREAQRDGEEAQESEVCPVVVEERAGDDHESAERKQDRDEEAPAERPPGADAAVHKDPTPLSAEDQRETDPLNVEGRERKEQHAGRDTGYQ
jgi:hypothetical protein